MINVRRLTKQNFAVQMFRYGFFYEQIPACFSATQFADNADELLKHLQPNSVFNTLPTEISIYKGPVSRRTISIPNPASFASTVLFLRNNWKRVCELSKSKNSHSSILFLHTYDDAGEQILNERINSEQMRESVCAKSSFVDNVKDRIIVSQDSKVRLCVDLSKFYSSVYTHALTWAVCGKNEAKLMHGNRMEKSADYNFADGFDKRIRSQKGKVTNGIITGPYTSRVFSEVLLANIDKMLRDGAKDRGGYVFRRYVDDYAFYFGTEYDAQMALLDIQSVLELFNLSINSAKTRIESYPFEVLSDLGESLRAAYDKGGIFELLNTAARLQQNGEKGAYKYALKMLKSKQFSKCDDPSLVLAQLFGIGLNDPRCSRYIADFLQSNEDRLDSKTLQTSINDKIREATRAHFDQEALNLLYLAKSLGLKLHWTVIIAILDHGCDLSKVIALDYVKQKTAYVIDESHHRAKIADAVKQLKISLDNESYDGERWLLLYECSFHGLLDVNTSPGETDGFFDKLSELGVSFYIPLE